MEVIHFAKSIIKDDVTRNLATLSKSIASARRNGVEVMKIEHLAEDASRVIDGGDFAKVFALVEEARRSLETTVALHTEVYDRIVETSGLLKEAADHGRDTSSASALLGKAKRLFEAGKYEEAKQALITCHSETEKIVAPFIASRRIPLVRDLLAVSRRMLLDLSSVERMVDSAESQIRYGSFVDALNTTKEAERLVKEALIKGISKQIAESRGTLVKARKAGADVRTAEQILLKAENLLREKRFNDSLRAVELAKNELDQSIIMERKAAEQMEKAQAIISDVQSFDIDVNPALEILRQAGNYSGMGRHGIAIELAKKAAEQASQAARANVTERLNKVESNYKSASLEGPDLGAAVAIRDGIVRLLDQRRFKETGALIKSMATEVERVLAQKKSSARTLLDVRKQLEEARRRGLRSDRTDSLLAKADERMRSGAFSEAFATAMRCSEELRSLAELFDRRMSDIEALSKDVKQLEADEQGAAGTPDLLNNAEEALRALDFEKASLNIQRARTAVNKAMESRAKEGLRNLVAMNRMVKELGIEEKLVPASLRKAVGMKAEEVKATDLQRMREGLETLRLLVLDKLTKKELELRGKVEVAKNAGADVAASMSLLTKARELITSRMFEEVPGVLADAEVSIGVAKEKRKSYLDLKMRCESLLESAKKKGLVMNGVAKLYREAEKERVRDYEKAIATMKEVIAVAEKEVASLLPEIAIEVDPPKEAAEGRWTKLKVHLRNDGTGLARDLSISMVGEIEVKGPNQIKWLRGGEKVSLDFEVMPRSKGPVSVTLNLACRPALSDELCGFKNSFELTAQ